MRQSTTINNLRKSHRMHPYHLDASKLYVTSTISDNDDHMSIVFSQTSKDHPTSPTTETSLNVMNQFAEASTIHGFKYICGQKHCLLARLAWLIVTCGGFVLCGVTLQPQVISFINGDTVTSETAEIDDELSFPAVTLCNSNMYKRSAIGSNARVREFATRQSPEIAAKYCSFDKSNPLVANESLDIGLLASELFIYGYMFVATDSYQSLLECKVLGKPRKCAELFTNLHTDHEICFTFNAGANLRHARLGDKFLTYPQIDEEMLNVSSAGVAASIELLLNVRLDDYCWTNGYGVGFLMAVHHPDVQPSINNQLWIHLAPGTYTSASVSTKKIVRNTRNIGRCIQSAHLTYFPNKTQYFLEDCLHDCMTKFVWDECHCFETTAPLSAFAHRFLTKQPLDMCITPQQAACVTDRKNNFTLLSQKQRCPNCLPPCARTVYTPTVSTLTFPAPNEMWLYKDKKYPNMTDAFIYMESTVDKHFPGFSQYYAQINSERGDFASEKEIRDNLAKVRIFLSSMSITVSTESPAVSEYELLSQIGGAVGLFLGASIMSFFEVIYWLWSGLLSLATPRTFKQLMKKEIS